MIKIDELINRPFCITEMATLKIEKFDGGFILLFYEGCNPDHLKWVYAGNHHRISSSRFTFYSYLFGKRVEVSYTFDEIRKGIEQYNSKKKQAEV